MLFELSDGTRVEAKEILSMMAVLSKENSELVHKTYELSDANRLLSYENAELLNKSRSLSDENAELLNKSQSLSDENAKLIEEIKILKEQLALLRSKRFGRSSEKLKKKMADIEKTIKEKEISLKLNAGANSDEEDENKDKARRKKLPDHLPRDKIELQPPLTCPDCNGTEFRKIDDDISEVFEYVPASFKVIQYIRPRCACKNCDKIVQAYAPSKGIDKGKAGFGLLAHVLVSKYCNHLPLYRQSQIYAREGIEISKSTLCGWAGRCAVLLEPLVAEIKKVVFGSDHIHGDETPVRVLDDTGGRKLGRLWAYVFDGRPHGSEAPPAVCYFYSPDRKGIRPEEHLKDFQGVLHADAYSGYNGVYTDSDNESTGISEAGCWAHVRRKFYEIMIVNKNAKVAQEAVEQIGKIYDIEREIRGMDPDTRRKIRISKSKELVESLFSSFKKVLGKLPQKGSTAKAIAYALNNEEALKRFLTDGKIEIDNNAAERALRAVAVGRKNWLFAGSDQGGHTAANIYTLIETAKLNNINPWKYLRKVLSVIQDYNSQKLSDLFPWNIMLE